MALSLHKKKPAPFNPEQIMQGEPSNQSLKLNMTAQVTLLFLEKPLRLYSPLLQMFGIQVTPEALISALSQSRNDARMKSCVLSVCAIMRAAVDEAVSPQDFEDILLREVDNIRTEEVPA